MNITSFNPMVVTDDSENLIRLFEDLGFEKNHQPVVDAGKGEVTETRMKDANGFCIDIVGAIGSTPNFTEIRINVDDLKEACAILEKHGFENTRGDATVDLETSKTAVMRSSSGCMISLVKHIK